MLTGKTYSRLYNDSRTAFLMKLTQTLLPLKYRQVAASIKISLNNVSLSSELAIILVCELFRCGGAFSIYCNLSTKYIDWIIIQIQVGTSVVKGGHQGEPRGGASGQAFP